MAVATIQVFSVPGTQYTREVGAAWVFTRTGATWTQEGPKLTPTDGSPPDRFGSTVSLSADGDTALIGSVRGNIGSPGCSAGPEMDRGATWVFSRSGSTWTEQAKLLGTGADGFDSNNPYHIALSANGDTALIGGNGDDDCTDTLGAAWLFTRTGSTWAQHGPMLTPATSGWYFGRSVALSADGKTALIDGSSETGQNHDPGQVWVLTRTATGLKQQGAL